MRNAATKPAKFDLATTLPRKKAASIDRTEKIRLRFEATVAVLFEANRKRFITSGNIGRLHWKKSGYDIPSVPSLPTAL